MTISAQCMVCGALNEFEDQAAGAWVRCARGHDYIAPTPGPTLFKDGGQTLFGSPALSHPPAPPMGASATHVQAAPAARPGWLREIFLSQRWHWHLVRLAVLFLLSAAFQPLKDWLNLKIAAGTSAGGDILIALTAYAWSRWK